MSKRIVVGLDPSAYSRSAQQFAVARAKLFGGTVIGVAVIDVVGIERAEASGAIGAGHLAHKAEEYHLNRARQTCQKLIDDFSELARTSGVSFEAILEEGAPLDVIVRASMSADLVVAGTRTYFHYETQDSPSDILRDLLHAKVCPVFVVPEAMQVPERVIFAYDGSVPAARTMRMFTYLTNHVPLANKVVLLHVNNDRAKGQALVAQPQRYLEAYGREVEVVIESGSPRQVVVEYAKKHMPAVVALGASSKGALAEFFMGGVSSDLLHDATVPLFISN